MKDWAYLALVIMGCAFCLGWYLGNIGLALIDKMDALMAKIDEIEAKREEAAL